MIWQNIYGCGIIYLSEQPEGECSHLSRWIIISNSRLDHTSEQDGYFLCAKFRIATIKLAVANNTMNSSYVLIIITSFCQISEKVRARPPAARTNILAYKIYYKYIRRATKKQSQSNWITDRQTRIAFITHFITCSPLPSLGEHPYTFLKAREKCSGFVYPTALAISPMDSVVSRRSSVAFDIR